MPPAGGAGYLLEYLFEIGPVMASGGGPAPVTHGEIAAWCDLTGIELSVWEARTLRRLSCDYLSESYRAEKADRAAPWQPELLRARLVAKSLQESILELSNL